MAMTSVNGDSKSGRRGHSSSGGGSSSSLTKLPAVSPQELISFSTKIVDLKDYGWIHERVTENPKFLVTSSDLPTILHEGFHYNALHQGARFGNAKVVQLILSLVSSNDFMRKLYPKDDPTVSKARTRKLTDAYLNTPDKGTNETPLHFACKFNCYEVVQLLLRHPLTNLELVNKQGATAQQVIGTRVGNSELEAAINGLFTRNKIVPFWRDEYGSTQPIIGNPVRPTCLGKYTPAALLVPFANIMLDLYPTDENVGIPEEGRLENKWTIAGYFGPTDEQTALMFYNYMTKKDVGNISLRRSPPTLMTDTPPGGVAASDMNMNEQNIADNTRNGSPKTPTKRRRSSGLIITHNMTSTPIKKVAAAAPGDGVREPLTDLNGILNEVDENGLGEPFEASPLPVLELLQQQQPQQQQPLTIPRLEELKTKHCSINTSTTGGATSSFVEENSLRLSDSEKGLECVGRRYAKELGSPWVEYWPFLSQYIDLNSPAGLQALNAYFVEQEKLIDIQVEHEKFCFSISEICSQFEKLSLQSMNMNGTSGQSGDGAGDSLLVSLCPEEEEDEEKEVDECYQSALDDDDTNSSGDNTNFKDCFTFTVYVKGKSRTKADDQLYAAISLVDEKLLDSFRAVSIWFNTMKSSLMKTYNGNGNLACRKAALQQVSQENFANLANDDNNSCLSDLKLSIDSSLSI